MIEQSDETVILPQLEDCGTDLLRLVQGICGMNHYHHQSIIWKRIEPCRGRNYYRTQRHQDADALYAFKSRGFGREIGLGTS